MNINGTIQVKIKNITHQYICKNYHNSGFAFIGDLYDNNGHFLSRYWMKELNVKTNFVGYDRLKKIVFANLS